MTRPLMEVGSGCAADRSVFALFARCAPMPFTRPVSSVVAKRRLSSAHPCFPIVKALASWIGSSDSVPLFTKKNFYINLV